MARSVTRAVAFAGLLLLYVWVGWASPGYDDEIFNIGLIESGATAGDLYRHVNSTDVHPPGQYLINNLLWDATNDWSMVRAITAACAATSIWLLWAGVTWQTPAAAVFAYLATGLNPALLLWCTGLRWYAYFVPLFNLMTVLLLRNPARPLRFWGSFFGLAVALFMVGYAALVLVPVAFVVAVRTRRAQLHADATVVIGLGLLALLLSGPQLIVFFTVHVQNAFFQVSNASLAVQGLLLHVFNNQGAMPVSLFGVSLMLANLALLGVALASFRTLRPGPIHGLFALGALGLAAAKVSARLRTLVTIAGLQGLIQATLFQDITRAPVAIGVFVLMLVGNVGGTFNVVMHRDTTRGSWNTPYAAVLADLRLHQQAPGCGSLEVVTHDPVLGYHASRLGATVIYVGEDGWEERTAAGQGCQVFAETFRGTLNGEVAAAYRRLIETVPGRVETRSFGLDRYAAFKRRFDPDVPDYYVTITYVNR